MLKNVFVIALVATALSACAHSMLDGPLPNYAGAGAATLYIQRPPGGIDALGTMPIALDGKPLGAIGVGEYWVLHVKPGMHNVSDNSSSVGVAFKPGSTHCVVVGVSLLGPYMHPAEHCPPPKTWKMAAQSRR